MTTPTAITTPTPTDNRRVVWIAAGVLGLASLAAAAGYALNSGGSAPTTLGDSLGGGESVVAPATPALVPAAPVVAPPAARPAPQVARVPVDKPPVVTAKAPVCADCGVVESVRAVTVKGEATGVGAVAGGVLGAVLGNQVGGGNGRKAMTVIGAVGGGLAGNEVEKRTRSTTRYQVGVRMQDGSLRSVEQSTAPAVGARVTVNGQVLKAASAKASGTRV